MSLLRRIEDFERPVFRPLRYRPLRSADIIEFPVRSFLTDLEDLRRWHPSPLTYLAPALLSGRSTGITRAATRRDANSATYLGPSQPQKWAPERAFFGLPQFPYLPAVLHLNPPNFQSIYTHMEHVVRCVRRRQRKQVMHALHKAGKPHRKGRRNQFSDVNC